MMDNQLVTNVNAIDTKIPSTSGLLTKTQYDWDKQDLERKIEDVGKKMPDTSELVKKIDYNTSIIVIEKKISSVTGLVTSCCQCKDDRDWKQNIWYY